MNAAKANVAHEPTSGARPRGVSGEREAAAEVRGMFGAIAPRYDLMNRLISFSMDNVWRRRAAKQFAVILARTDSRALDICCGTGDLTMALLRRSRGVIYGVDFAHPMIVRATQKTPSLGRAGGKLGGYVEGDALSLPFADETFDLITIGFGFRNLANYDAGLREMFRVLKKNGQLGILEFSPPRGRIFPTLHRLYFKYVVRRLGNAISGSGWAYSYLPDSIGRFPTAEELVARMSAVGFSKPGFKLWFGGSFGLHTGTKA
jgi:demethylmenaquinone methyltransferase/2-methoxy-6-polyprenyl-1,4-benzoquinol methylase